MEPALEARISARIAEMMRGRTILVVSHRADPAFKADHTIRVEAGRVIATRT
jgi:ABC-type transport system involved in cytochrome bd biosynthesis fused ATPase/permease subunit